MMMPTKLLAFAVSLLLGFSALAQSGSVEIKEAWARATPGKAENGAAYLTLASPTGDRLIGISTPVARKAELHAMKLEGGVMMMTPLEAVDLPAGQAVTLKPGAVHIMLVGLKRPLQQGQTVQLTLRFAKAGTREVAAAIGKVGATAPESHAGSHRHSHEGAPR